VTEHVFVSLDGASSKIEQGRLEYNRERPHLILGHLTPKDFAANNQSSPAIA
jgi:transposase InsO family protein